MPEEMLCPKEAAARLRISIVAFYRMLRTKRGPPAFRVGSAWRIPAEKFREWQENGGTPEHLVGQQGRWNRKRR